MVEIKAELIAQPKEGENYNIVEVKEIEVETRGGNYPALRVLMKSVNKEDKLAYSVSLWLSDTTGSRSKLGSFIDAFSGKVNDASETEDWLGHTVKFIKWRTKDREIEVIA